MTHPLQQLIRKLAPEEAQELAETLEESVLESVTLAILETVPEEKLPVLDLVCETGSAEELAQFLEEHAPRFEEVFQESLARLKSETRTVLS